MKKLTFSLFAVLAILVGVTSAFTTKESNAKFTTTYKFYGLTNNALSNSLPTLPSVSQVTNNGTQFYSTGTNISIAAAFTASSPTNDGCNDDELHLCAAKIKDIDGTETVEEAVDGDYHAN